VIEPRRYWAKSRGDLRRIADEISRLAVGPRDVVEIVIRPARTHRDERFRGILRRALHAVIGDIAREIGETPKYVKNEIKLDYYGAPESGAELPSTEDEDEDGTRVLIDFAYQWAAERGVLIPDRRPQTTGSTV
jgi:hypothetical protein